MDAEKVKVEGGHGDQGMHPVLLQAAVPHLHEPAHVFGGIRGGHGLEAYPFLAVGISLDDIAFPVLVFAGIPDLAPGKTMQFPDGLLSYRQISRLTVNQVQGPPISAYLFFVPVAKQFLSEPPA